MIVNAACALQKHGHHIKIFTAHHDVTHCFEETRGDGRQIFVLKPSFSSNFFAGPLASCIRVYGDWLPRTIGGKMYALCAFIRMVYLSIVAICTIATETDVFFIDQVSIPIPLLRMTGIPVLFYCHFPDKMLCTQRSSVFKRLYRFPLDFLEEITTGRSIGWKSFTPPLNCFQESQIAFSSIVSTRPQSFVVHFDCCLI